MTVMETTTCFGLYWPSSGCLENLRASYMLFVVVGGGVVLDGENPPTTNRVIV